MTRRALACFGLSFLTSLPVLSAQTLLLSEGALGADTFAFSQAGQSAGELEIIGGQLEAAYLWQNSVGQTIDSGTLTLGSLTLDSNGNGLDDWTEAGLAFNRTLSGYAVGDGGSIWTVTSTFSRASGEIIGSFIMDWQPYNNSLTLSGLTGTWSTPVSTELPVITQQPQAIVVEAGLAYAFDAKAEGEALTYQWTKDGVPVGAEAPASNAARFSEAGAYQLHVTNPAGTVDSDAVTLTVLEPTTHLKTTVLDDERLQLQWYARDDHVYTVQASTNLVQWDAVGDAITGAGASIFIEVPLNAPQGSPLFYRLDEDYP